MNKSAINSFAIWARVQLIEAAKQRAFEYGIIENQPSDASLEMVGERLLSKNEVEQRRELIIQIQRKGYSQVMEEAAYTWFNRFIALRYMEVNGYLPSQVRVFTNAEGEFKPEILQEALSLDLEGKNQGIVLDLIESQNNEELYKYLLITQCNALIKGLPYMFEKISNWVELLFPSNLLRPDSVIGRMITDIPEEDWKDAVQIIGWMYQFFNEERKNAVINIYKGVVKKEDIPAATQLFTPDWIVRYIVDNSLGRYWIERNPNSELASKLEFFITPKEGQINYVHEIIKPEELTIFDPCMGSAHFLVYAFDVLLDIYLENGWSERDAAKSIIENNLYGLDIDDRASQLAYFAVMMKGRKHNRRILEGNIQPNMHAIQETHFMNEELINFVANSNQQIEKDLRSLRDLFINAKEFGSLLVVNDIDFKLLYSRLSDIESNQYKMEDYLLKITASKQLLPVVKQAEILSRKYCAVTTNPPFLNKMDAKLKKFVRENYKDYSGDLFSVFIYRNFGFCVKSGYSGLLSPFVWMFIKTYEKLRNYIIENKSIVSLIQMEYSAFEDATVPLCTFVLRNAKETDNGYYFRLSDFRGGMGVQKEKTLEAITDRECGYYYETSERQFSKIPGSPIAYWASDQMFKLFNCAPSLSYLATPKQGLATTDNNRFLRYWYEINISYIKFGASDTEMAKNSQAKWFPYNKGGEFRKWFGNNEFIVNYFNDGEEIKSNVLRKYPYLKNPDFVVKNTNYYFKKALSWSLVSSGSAAFRYIEPGFIFDVAGMSCFSETRLMYLLALFNSVVTKEILSLIAPTINFQVGDIASIPVVINNNQRHIVEDITAENILCSKIDWDSFETSWDFKRHPLI